MKINWNYIKFFSGILILILLFSFSNKRNENRKLTKVNVEFIEANHPFITYPMVNKLLIQNDDSITSVAKERLALNKLEGVLNTNKMISDAHVYHTINGELGAKIKQKKPIARVGASTSFYIDSDGESMPLSPIFSARVPLVTGSVDKRKLEDIHMLAKYVYEDDFLSKNIIGIHKSNLSYELMLRKDDFKIVFGTTNNMEKKFRNFKAFYIKAQKDGILKNYQKVDLRYNNQVICTKK